MSIIKVFNSYVINDISNIIYEYYFDDSKIIQAKKDFFIEFHKKVIIHDYNDGYYTESITYNDCNINYRPGAQWYSSAGHRISMDTIFRIDKEDIHAIASGKIPDNYIIYSDYFLRDILEHPNWYPSISTEWARKQLLLKNRFEVK